MDPSIELAWYGLGDLYNLRVLNGRGESELLYRYIIRKRYNDIHRNYVGHAANYMELIETYWEPDRSEVVETAAATLVEAGKKALEGRIMYFRSLKEDPYLWRVIDDVNTDTHPVADSTTAPDSTVTADASSPDTTTPPNREDDEDDDVVDDLSKLNYTGMFIKETLRMFPPVPAISRQLSKPLTIDGVEVPAGMTVIVSIYAMHRNPDVWENPEEFRPERFAEDKFSSRHPYSFVPFSAGPRNCIGQNFAMNEEKVIVARIVNRFRLVLDTGHPVGWLPQVVLRSTNGIKIKFHPRT